MKIIQKILLLLIFALLLSSCGALPTLPPLDSTVTIRTPNFTEVPPLETKTGIVETSVHMVTPTATFDGTPRSGTIQPSPTKTKQLASTSTEIPGSPTPEYSATQPPTSLPTSTPTATSTNTPEPTFTPTPVPYKLQLMNPYYLSNFTHVDLGCDWMGIAGQIFDSEGLVQKEILIKAGGDVLGSPIVEEMTMPLTDSEIDLAYGPGGYELTLAYLPADTEDSVWIQLFNLAGDPLSEKVFLTTYDDCLKNLILMNFTEQ